MKQVLKHKATSKEEMSCKDCRHANQETGDYREGLVACKFGFGLRANSTCDIIIAAKDGEYYMYDRYNNNNCTWLSDEDIEVTTEGE